MCEWIVLLCLSLRLHRNWSNLALPYSKFSARPAGEGAGGSAPHPARALALDPLDLCLQLTLTHPDLTRSRWARRRRRHWRPSPCPEVAASGNAAATLVDLKGYSRLIDLKRGTGDSLAEPVLTKMITGFGQKNALPKLGMAVPVMVHYRFGS